MDDKAVIQLVHQCDPQTFEVWRVRYYKGWRKMKNEETHPITIEVLEGSTAVHPVWYHVKATDGETGAIAYGNGGQDLFTAFDTLHWAEFDIDPPRSLRVPPGSLEARHSGSRKAMGQARQTRRRRKTR
jgi:hypothetical protein